VHGGDGLDELSTTGASRIVELRDGEIRAFEVHPDEAGLPLCGIADLTGGSPDDNAMAIRSVLSGEKGRFRDIVLLNAAAAFIIAGKAESLPEGVKLAAASIDEGNAQAALDALIAASQEQRTEAAA
jgi:anthranilate phosphoribosyltransferase